MSTSHVNNPYLDQPFEPPVTSWLQSIGSGAAISFLLAKLKDGNSKPSLASFLFSVGMVHLLPRLRLWQATIERRGKLNNMASKKIKERNARRDKLRKSVVLDDLEAESGICQLLAHELLEKMRNKTLTCEQVVRAFCSRALRLGEITSAVTVEIYDEAIARAIEVDSIRSRPDYNVLDEPPLLGLPFSVKDQINVKGYDSTAGVQVRVFAPAEEDAAVVTLLREAGAIPFVKTNIPQSLMITESKNMIFGQANNPWNIKRTPGGSSGGEGAIIGMDASPIGIGTDIGGSIRTPCGYCGIVGLKPSSGRITRVGLMSARYKQRNGQEGIKSVVGPMARSVPDLVMMMNAWLKPRQHDWDFDGVSPQPAFNMKEYVSEKKLRIGYVVSDDFYPSCITSRRAVMEAVNALRSKGHTVIELKTKNTEGDGVLGGLHQATNNFTVLPGFGDAFGLFAKILGADGTMHFQRKGLQGEDMLDDYKLQYYLGLIPDVLRHMLAPIVSKLFGERMSRLLVTLRTSMSAKEYWATLATRTEYKKRFENVYRNYSLDCLLTPGSALPAHIHGKFSTIVLGNCYMSLYNLLDWCAGSVPITVVSQAEDGIYKGSIYQDNYDQKARDQMIGAAGLPIGIQIAAPSGKEETVLKAMRDLEEVIQFRTTYEPNGLGKELPSRL